MEGPYSPGDVRRAVNLSAVLGWAVVSLWSVGSFWQLYPYAAFIGLPVAFAASWVIGAPVLRRVMRQSLSFPRAASCGGIIAALFALIGFMIGRLLGWQPSVNATSWWTGEGTHLQSADGILTPYGWMIVAQNSLILIAIGAGIGVAVRAWIGPGAAVRA